MKNEKKSENVFSEECHKTLFDGNFLFSFGGGREEAKAGGINYKEIFSRDFKIKVLAVFIHLPILLKPTNLNTGKQ